MILESVFNLFSSAIKLIFAWIQLPDLPPEVESYIAIMFDYIEGGIGFLFLVFNMDLVKVLLPLVIAVANFDKVYKLVLFVLRKIPFLGIK